MHFLGTTFSWLSANESANKSDRNVNKRCFHRSNIRITLEIRKIELDEQLRDRKLLTVAIAADCVSCWWVILPPSSGSGPLTVSSRILITSSSILIEKYTDYIISYKKMNINLLYNYECNYICTMYVYFHKVWQAM